MQSRGVLDQFLALTLPIPQMHQKAPKNATIPMQTPSKTPEIWVKHTQKHPKTPLCASQSGALFGLDARIALAIFSLISVVAGATMVLSLDTIRAKSLAAELADTGRAVEAFHNDVKMDIYQVLITPSARNAFAALYDHTVISEEFRARWNGPYIKFASNQNPRYGTMALPKRGAVFSAECSSESICYLWIAYNAVKPGIATETNEILDGKTEESPNHHGRLQWTDPNEGLVTLGFQASKALTPSMGAE
jgi:hypothetical protein